MGRDGRLRLRLSVTDTCTMETYWSGECRHHEQLGADDTRIARFVRIADAQLERRRAASYRPLIGDAAIDEFWGLASAPALGKEVA